MNDVRTKAGWVQKFANAFRGVAVGVGGQNSFKVHIPVACLVVAAMFWLQLNLVQCSVLLTCIAMVLVCELINSSLEKLAKAITRQYDADVRDALDIASGAVLLASAFSVVIGGMVLLQSLLAV